MAFSLSSSKTRQIPIGDLSKEQFLALAMEAARHSDWSLGQTTSKGFTAFTGFSLSSFSEEISLKIQEDTALVKSECVGSQLYDWGKNNRNLHNFNVALEELKTRFSAEELTERYEAFKAEESILEESEQIETSEKKATFFSLFIPARGYFVTPLLLNLNLLVFIIMAISGADIMMPDNEILLTFGANFQPSTLEGEAWRLLTCCFIHIGIFHLLMNMYALVYIGTLLEPLLGRTRYLLAFLVTGIAGSLVSVWWHPLTVSAGASGAIFGMYGVFLALLTTNYLERSARRAFLTSILVFVSYNLLNGLKPGIDNAAHLGGLVTGILIGYAFLPSLKNYNDLSLKRQTLAFVAVTFSLTAGLIFSRLPNTMKIYDAQMTRFSELEQLGLEVYNIRNDAPKEEILSEITQRGFYYWNENLKIVDELEELRLPENLVERNKLLRQYCELRLKSYELLFKIVKEENPDRYKSLLTRYNAQIEGLVEKLK
jgi:rhomboid protease GluP